MQCQEFAYKANVPHSVEPCELESPSPVSDRDSIPTPSVPSTSAFHGA